VLGANLLNAARMNPPSSIPEWMVRKHGPGKLKRISMKRDDNSKQNLAIRGDPYEIELSPEKGRYALPEKVNHKPLKILNKKKGRKRIVEAASKVPVASSELPVHDKGGQDVNPEELVENLALAEDLDSAEPDIRSSPPELAAPGNDAVAVDGTRQETLLSIGDIPTDAPEDRADTQATSKRKSESDHSEDGPTKFQREQRTTVGDSISSRKNQPQVQVSVRRKSQEKKATKPTGHDNSIRGTQEEDSRLELATQKAKSQRKRINDTTGISQQLPAKKRGSQGRAEYSRKAPETAEAVATETAPVISESEHGSDEEGSESVADDDNKMVRLTGQPGSIETVFEFLNLEARSEKCRTKVATSIRRMCNMYSAHLQDSHLSIDRVLEETNGLQETLRQISTSVQEKDRCAFKGDAYGRVFRALTVYLEALYNWLHEYGGTVTDSLEAMRILSTLTHQILAFKDTIMDWDVSVPQRFKGDRIIKDVDINLIAHLRHVYKTYRKRLSRLEATEQYREQQADFERKMKEKEEDEDRKAKSVEARAERWKRWQDLHIKRMLCEPDARRRRRLAITRLEDLEERDANGIIFERLPVFKSRSAPPHRHASTVDDDPEWTEQEETALLDGLKHCAGMSRFLCFIL
jgi:hypothetical protein